MNNSPLVTFKQVGPITIGTVEASSVVNMVNVAEFGAAVLAYVHDHPGLHLLLNFSHVYYLTSDVLSQLVKINKAVMRSAGTLWLCGINANIMQIFDITGLNKVFHIERGVRHAIKRYAKRLNAEPAEFGEAESG